MKKLFLNSFYNLVDLLKRDSRCLGAWYYGSISRGLEDDFSDIDVVFLIDGNHFEGFSAVITDYVATSCDEVVNVWPESYNCDELKNFQHVIRLKDDLYMIDFFVLNSIKNDCWIARQHYMDLLPNQVIFDKSGAVKELIKRSPTGSKVNIDIPYVIKTYYTHLCMLKKYFLRCDYFKLRKNIDFLYNAHTELLLSQYDKIGWGDYCNKIKQCIPKNMQEHLKLYMTSPDIDIMKREILICAECFALDAQKICLDNKIQYPKHTEKLIIKEFKKCLIVS